jgi:hypothetical protein
VPPGPTDLPARLAAVGPRPACGNGERLAALALRDELRGRGRPARVEPAWVRPQSPLVQAALCAIGVAGSLVALSRPAIGLGLVGAALVLLPAEASGRLPTALLPRRATQNVVSEPPVVPPGARVRLVVTAAIDAPRAGLLRKVPFAPALLCAFLAVLAAIAGARLAGADGGWLGLVALVPAVGLVVGAFGLAELGLAHPTDGGPETRALSDALALVAALDADPPRHLAVELVLAGAAAPGQLGMRAYVRARRRGARPEELAVLALAPADRGPARHHRAEGPVVPLRLHPGLRAAATAAGLPAGRAGITGAWAARRVRWPAVGLTNAPSDACLALVRRLDAELAS